MAFSSPAFLFAFLPAFLAIYFAAPTRFRNGVILVASLLFYFIDGGGLTIILCASILVNYFIALYFGKLTGSTKKTILGLGMVLNLLPLLYYKYWMFLTQSANDVAVLLNSKAHFTVSQILLPAGVSFFTFHAISYLLDVYNRKVEPATSLVDFGMYMANFPQLIAGPIVRYSEIVNVVKNRKVRLEQIYSGLFAFVIGLSKKIILADSVGNVADSIFALPQGELTTGLAWLGALAYSLQIYFDFSGYSNMAIGLGRVMGFEFPQNFDQPYRSQNVTEFWRRWHMTLSRWFRDYLYIPLGGNRAGEYRTLANLFIVFFLCGLWHGASYGFIVWGIYHGVLLIIERELLSRLGFAMSGWVGQAITFLLVMIGWVFFRTSSLSVAVDYLGVMANIHTHQATVQTIPILLGADKITFLLLAAVCAIFPTERLMRMNFMSGSGAGVIGIQWAALIMLMSFSIMLIAANGFNPFIYFRF
ncbi:MAG: MBOAT family O-acyltransferase [Burkholderiaceae bacterium]